jgi:hypothetical protein
MRLVSLLSAEFEMHVDLFEVIFCWKVLELNKVREELLADARVVNISCMIPKKFRLYILDSDKSMILLSYLLTYGLEIKDKPRGWLVLNYLIMLTCN